MSAQVQPGQLLLRPMLVTAAEVTGGVALPAGMLAVSVNLCLPEAVAENIGPGSEVEVLDTLAPAASSLTAGPNCTGPHQQQAKGHARTLAVLPRVQVLSVGLAGGAGHATSSSNTSAFNRSSTDPSSSQPGNVLVTLAVTQAAALRLVQITETGLPYLALLQH
jgi:pilus assembly protein CpaB